MPNVKRVYTFGNKQAEGNGKMRELLGGKGANLAEMNLIGIPVPPGFTITTEVCAEYYTLGKEGVVKLIKPEVEAAMKRFAKEDKNAYLIDMSDAELMGDRLHFNQNSAEYLGKQMYEQIKAIR